MLAVLAPRCSRDAAPSASSPGSEMCWRARRCGSIAIHSMRPSTITCISARRPLRAAVPLRAGVADAIEAKDAAGQGGECAPAIDGRKLRPARRRCRAQPGSEMAPARQWAVGGLVGGLRPRLLPREWPHPSDRARRRCLQSLCGRTGAELQCDLRRSLGQQPQWRADEPFCHRHLHRRPGRPPTHTRPRQANCPSIRITRTTASRWAGTGRCP